MSVSMRSESHTTMRSPRPTKPAWSGSWPDPPPDTFHETTTIVESPVATRLRTQAMDVAIYTPSAGVKHYAS